MLRITELQTQLLEALARYKYLTASQFQTLGISSSRPVLWRNLRALSQAAQKSKRLVEVINFPAAMRIEHVEKVHYLTRRGAEVLAEILGVDSGELDFQEVTSAYHRDYWHRKWCIDLQIWLTLALDSRYPELEIAVCDRYFDKTGANRTTNSRRGRLRAKTRVDLKQDGFYLIPDLNLLIRHREQSEQQALYAIEMTNGRDTKRVLDKLTRHVALMRDGALSRHYGLGCNYQALFVFAEPGLMTAVQDRFANAVPPGFADSFLFAKLTAAEEDVLRCWWRGGTELGRRRDLLTGRMVSSGSEAPVAASAFPERSTSRATAAGKSFLDVV